MLAVCVCVCVCVCLQVREGDCEIERERDGRSNGLAYVNFSSRNMANQAIKGKNGKYIGSRFVELSLC